MLLTSFLYFFWNFLSPKSVISKFLLIYSLPYKPLNFLLEFLTLYKQPHLKPRFLIPTLDNLTNDLFVVYSIAKVKNKKTLRFITRKTDITVELTNIKK